MSRYAQLFPHLIEPGPVVAFPLTAPIQPFEDDTLRIPVELAQHLAVADHSVVVPVAPELASEHGRDPPDPLVAVLLDPLREVLQGLSELLLAPRFLPQLQQGA